MSSLLLPTTSLLKREIIRFFRQRTRILGAFGTPLVFWFLMGSGLKNSFKGDLNYLQYFFPGTILLILLFTAIFSTISIIEDRREGFLQAVLVSPASRSSIVLGKLLGGTLLAVVQGLLFLALSPVLGITFGFVSFLYLLSILIVISFGLTGLGFIIAWKLDSTQGFHAIMNLFLMPLWLLSGALFPLQGTPAWLKGVMLANPLTYAMSGLHIGFFGGYPSSFSFLNSFQVCLGVCLGFGLFMYFLSLKIAKDSN